MHGYSFFTSISFHIIPYHSISFHIVPYHSISFHIIPYHSISCHIIPYHSIYLHISPSLMTKSHKIHPARQHHPTISHHIPPYPSFKRTPTCAWLHSAARACAVGQSLRPPEGGSQGPPDDGNLTIKNWDMMGI